MSISVFFRLNYLTVTLSVTPLCLYVITDREGQRTSLIIADVPQVGEIYVFTLKPTYCI